MATVDLISPEAGRVWIGSSELGNGGPREARRLGLMTAYQDSSLVQDLTVRENLEKQGITFLSAEVAKIPQNTVAVSDPDTILKIQKMLDLLEENDDVQNVFHNADLPDEDEEE
jgi:ABC-type sugar transport system ATPase subunit